MLAASIFAQDVDNPATSCLRSALLERYNRGEHRAPRGGDGGAHGFSLHPDTRELVAHADAEASLLKRAAVEALVEATTETVAADGAARQVLSAETLDARYSFLACCRVTGSDMACELAGACKSISRDDVAAELRQLRESAPATGDDRGRPFLLEARVGDNTVLLGLNAWIREALAREHTFGALVSRALAALGDAAAPPGRYLLLQPLRAEDVPAGLLDGVECVLEGKFFPDACAYVDHGGAGAGGGAGLQASYPDALVARKRPVVVSLPVNNHKRAREDDA